MNVQAIYQNADITSQSATGEINKVAISHDEYDYLVDLTGFINKHDHHSDDIVEMDYYDEFLPMIDKAKSVVVSS